jgi:hypothetical protein
MKSSDSPRTEPSTPKISLTDRLDEIDEISSLHLDKIEEEDRIDNMSIFLDSIFVM